jgi:hypothetical protein
MLYVTRIAASPSGKKQRLVRKDRKVDTKRQNRKMSRRLQAVGSNGAWL